MFWIWYLRIMGLLYIIAVAVGIFRYKSIEFQTVDLLDGSYMVGSVFEQPSLGEEVGLFVVRVWNFAIRSIPGVVLIALGEGLAALFYIERRLKQRTRTPVPPPNVPSYAARPRSSVPEDWR